MSEQGAASCQTARGLKSAAIDLQGTGEARHLASCWTFEARLYRSQPASGQDRSKQECQLRRFRTPRSNTHIITSAVSVRHYETIGKERFVKSATIIASRQIQFGYNSSKRCTREDKEL